MMVFFSCGSTMGVLGTPFCGFSERFESDENLVIQHYGDGYFLRLYGT